MENTSNNGKKFATKVFLEQIKSMTLENIEEFVKLDSERGLYVLNGQIYQEICAYTIDKEVKRDEK